MGRRTDKRTGPNLPADTDIDDVEEQDDDADEQDDQDESASEEQEQAPGKREQRYRKQRNEARSERDRLKNELTALKAKAEEAPKANKRTRQAQEELAFVKAAAAEGVQDVEAAWKLCDRELLTWEEDDDDGPRLDGIEDALAHVLDRYPYVASDRTGDDDEDDDRVQPPRATTSGKPTNGPRKGPKGLDRAYLERKYPSLQRSRRRLI